MNRKLNTAWLVLAACATAAALFMAGCDDEDDFDHSPAAGQGAIVIDNNGDEDVRVYIGGAHVGNVSDGHWSAFDRAPGVYRVVLDEADDDLSYRGDIDVIAGRLTVLDVSGDADRDGNLGVSVSFE
ncbi:MAG: hypothetical protein PHR35_15565 [Kiritimatiellae bacterium]|nr:hypothetical protein [Kiritimatiellia bacterium]